VECIVITLRLHVILLNLPFVMHLRQPTCELLVEHHVSEIV